MAQDFFSLIVQSKLDAMKLSIMTISITTFRIIIIIITINKVRHSAK
jgi:hypothetical protein